MKRISQLDGVRGVAILMVIVWHYFVCQTIAEPGSFTVYLVARAANLTWSGVDLFFVLSGFLVTGTLLDHRRTSNLFRVFYLRRACRIFPLYFLVFGLFLGVAASPLYVSPSFAWLLRNPLPYWSYATFTQNFFMGIAGGFGANWLGVTWSLAIEEQFYLCIPLLIYLLPRRVLVPLFGLAIFSASLLRWASPGFHAFVDTPWRCDSLLSGALLAMLVRWHPMVTFVRQHRRMFLASFIFLLLGAGVLTWRPGCFGSFDHLWLAALYSAFILLAFMGDKSFVGRTLESPVLIWLGRLSFGIYMFHQTVSGICYGVLRHGMPQIRTPFDPAITLAALGITLALATLSYRFFESPFLRLGHRLRYLPKPGGTMVPGGAQRDATAIATGRSVPGHGTGASRRWMAKEYPPQPHNPASP